MDFILLMLHQLDSIFSAWTYWWVNVCIYGIFSFGLLVSFAAGDADEFLDTASVPQGLGVLHVLGDDLMQRTADSCDGVIRHGLSHQDAAVGASSPATAVVVVAAPRQTVHQVPHGVFTCEHGWTGSDSDSVIVVK